MSPRSQVTVPALSVQAPPVADTNTSEAGIGSVTVTPVACDGPSLRTVMTNVAFVPGTTGSGSMRLLIARSASAVTATDAVAVSLDASGSSVSDDTDAVLSS